MLSSFPLLVIVFKFGDCITFCNGHSPLLHQISVNDSIKTLIQILKLHFVYKHIKQRQDIYLDLTDDLHYNSLFIFHCTTPVQSLKRPYGLTKPIQHFLFRGPSSAKQTAVRPTEISMHLLILILNK